MLIENVSETLSTLAEPKAKEMIDDLIREIEDEIDTDEAPSPIESDDQESVDQDTENDSEDL